MSKDYCIASGQFLKGIRKPLRSAQTTKILAGKIFLLAECDEKFGEMRPLAKGRRLNCPAGAGKTVAISLLFR
jgi:hypothetical protein